MRDSAVFLAWTYASNDTTESDVGTGTSFPVDTPCRPPMEGSADARRLGRDRTSRSSATARRSRPGRRSTAEHRQLRVLLAQLGVAQCQVRRVAGVELDSLVEFRVTHGRGVLPRPARLGVRRESVRRRGADRTGKGKGRAREGAADTIAPVARITDGAT